MDTGQQIVIILSIFLAAWYFVFAVINRRRGLGVYAWMRTGLKQLGEISQAAWIGSSGSGARLVLENPEKPFQRIEAIYLLESREILPLWIFNRLRGKRDQMILKATLRGAPAAEIEAGTAGEREFESALTRDLKNPYSRAAVEGGLEVAWRGVHSARLQQGLREFLGRHPGQVRRLSLQKGKPHLILQSQLPDVRSQPAEQFFKELRELFQDI